MFQWGNADMFHVTNFLDQPDLRELFSSDREDSNKGVFALKGKIIWRSFSLEAALVPVHSRPLYPQNDSFWNIVPEQMNLPIPNQYQLFLGGKDSVLVNPVFADQKQTPAIWDNSMYGLRVGGTMGPIDAYLSYFHGISNSVSIYPEIELRQESAESPIMNIESLAMRPIYHTIDSFGLDIAFNINRFAIRLEGQLNPKKRAMIENSYTMVEKDGVNYLMPQFLWASYASYTFGVDANLWGEDGRVLAEWTQGFYLEEKEKRRGLVDPLLSQILLFHLEDKFFRKRLVVSIGTLMRPTNDLVGWAPFVNVKWDFLNGMEMSLGSMIFYSREEELFSLFEDNDHFFIKAKMSF